MNDEHKSVKITYTYFLPEHNYELFVLQHADEWLSALHAIDDALRSTLKYDADAKLSVDEYAQKIRDMIPENIWD